MNTSINYCGFVDMVLGYRDQDRGRKTTSRSAAVQTPVKQKDKNFPQRLAIDIKK